MSKPNDVPIQGDNPNVDTHVEPVVVQPSTDIEPVAMPIEPVAMPIEKSNVTEYQEPISNTKSLKNKINDRLINGIIGPANVLLRRSQASIKDSAYDAVGRLNKVLGFSAFSPDTNQYKNTSAAGGSNKQRTKKRFKHRKHRKTKRTIQK